MSSDEEAKSDDVDMSIPLKDVAKKKTINWAETPSGEGPFEKKKPKESGEGTSQKKKPGESGEVLNLLNTIFGKMDAFDTRTASLESATREKVPETLTEPVVDEASKVECDANASGE